MPAARVSPIVFSVASALDAAHAAGLIHRDVKPANMLIDARPHRPDHVYLSDFGLSKGAMSSGLTATGQFLGTVDYCAPEQIEGRAVDGRTDEYALACAAFELLAGTAPFRRDQATATIWAHISEPPPRVTARRGDLSPAADQVFARAMAKAPAHRYASCREFADALRRALAAVPYSPGPVRGPAARPATRICDPPSRPAPPARPVPQARPVSPGSWQRDWTNWALILALPLMIAGVRIALLGRVADKGAGLVFLIGFLAIPVGLVTKLVRWLRQRLASPHSPAGRR